MTICILTKTHPKELEGNQDLLILGWDPENAKNFHLISLLCYKHKLSEHLVINMLAPCIEPAIIHQHAGFEPGKSTSQLLNLAEQTEDNRSRFHSSFAICDTLKHCLLLKKILELTNDLADTDCIKVLWKISVSLWVWTTCKVAGNDNGKFYPKVMC